MGQGLSSAGSWIQALTLFVVATHAMKILIADDHRLIVEAVADKLSELGPDVSIIQAMSVQELLSSLSDDVDLALIDVQMPGAVRLSHVQEVRRRFPALKLIVLSGLEDRVIMREALDAGAMGFIPKTYSPAVMLSAVRLVLNGGVYVPPMMLGREGELSAEPAADPSAHGAAEPDAWQQLASALTDRQLAVLRLLSEGLPNKLIGESLGISEGTVKIHLAAIFRVLKVRNRTEAVVASRRLTGM